MIEGTMTDKELILNFVNQYDRPFNAELTSKQTCVSIERPLNNTPAFELR